MKVFCESALRQTNKFLTLYYINENKKGTLWKLHLKIMMSW